MQRDLPGGILLIAGSLAGMLVMALHPTSHDLLTAQEFARPARLNMIVHGLAIASVPVLFLGLLAVSRRLGWSDLTVAASVAYGFGGVAVLVAAVASGFVATGVFERMLEAEGETRALYHALAGYTGLINQGFAKVSVVATSSAILLWSWAILQSHRLPRAAGVAGALIGGLVVLAVLSGHLRLGLHGFGLVVVAQSVWMIWLGVVLLRGRAPGS